MVLAAPLPMPVRNGEVVLPGKIYRGRPKDFLPPGRTDNGHPVVVLTHPDENGHVMIAEIGHNLPDQSNSKPTTEYGIASFRNRKGFDHRISLTAKKVHINNLSHKIGPIGNHRVSGIHLSNLQKDTGIA